jgi:predicted HNH restriction endonuclease
MTVGGAYISRATVHKEGFMEFKSILIKDTTREERQKIVAQALSVCGGACDLCGACDTIGGGRIDDIYQPYIDGEKEIAEINAEYRRSTVK